MGDESGSVHRWNQKAIARWYASNSRGLWPDEVHALGASWKFIAGRPVLDIGIGAGRTTPHLKAVASSYVGIDISEAMLVEARKANPSADLRIGDARHLSFEAETFSFALFSFNGIDYIPPGERMQVLKEVRRVLQPGGAFVFSSHNRLVQADRPPGFIPPQTYGRGLLRRAASTLRNVSVSRRARRNYDRLKAQEWVAPELAWINDGAYESAFLSCHITPAEQIRQLRSAGFSSVDMILDTSGQLVDTSMRDRFFYVRALRD